MSAEPINVNIVDGPGSQMDDEIILKTDESLAEFKKENGNELYKIKKYQQAIPFYTEAIDLCPETASYYGNRAACYMMLMQYKEALVDARKSVTLDPSFVKGYVRIAKCCLALGDINAAVHAVNRVLELEPGSTQVAAESSKIETIKKFEEEEQKAFAQKDYRRVVYIMDRILDIVNCAKYKIRKAECLTYIGRYQEAQDIANNLLHVDKGNADAIWVRGMCLYYEDKLDQAFQHFQQVLRLAPDHQGAKESFKRAKALKLKKEEGNETFKTGRLQEAFNLYSQALEIDPFNRTTNAKLYFNRATVASKLGRIRDAIVDCSSALELDTTYLKALLRRAKCYTDLGEYEESVRDYEAAFKMDKSREVKYLLQEAKAALKRSKRKDYYKILGIDRNASSDEIKKAYRKRAMVFHPDKHANASETEKKEQERRFKEVGEAYGVLSDPSKRARYDNGQDLEDMEHTSNIDPNHVFQAFFGDGAYGFPSGGGFTFQFS